MNTTKDRKKEQTLINSHYTPWITTAKSKSLFSFSCISFQLLYICGILKISFESFLYGFMVLYRLFHLLFYFWIPRNTKLKAYSSAHINIDIPSLPIRLIVFLDKHMCYLKCLWKSTKYVGAWHDIATTTQFIHGSYFVWNPLKQKYTRSCVLRG